jgi:hypothetical protein
MANNKKGGAAVTKVARDAGTGLFITMSEAKQRPKGTVVETIKRPIKKK